MASQQVDPIAVLLQALTNAGNIRQGMGQQQLALNAQDLQADELASMDRLRQSQIEDAELARLDAERARLRSEATADALAQGFDTKALIGDIEANPTVPDVGDGLGGFALTPPTMDSSVDGLTRALADQAAYSGDPRMAAFFGTNENPALGLSNAASRALGEKPSIDQILARDIHEDNHALARDQYDMNVKGMGFQSFMEAVQLIPGFDRSKVKSMTPGGVFEAMREQNLHQTLPAIQLQLDYGRSIYQTNVQRYLGELQAFTQSEQARAQYGVAALNAMMERETKALEEGSKAINAWAGVIDSIAKGKDAGLDDDFMANAGVGFGNLTSWMNSLLVSTGHLSPNAQGPFGQLSMGTFFSSVPPEAYFPSVPANKVNEAIQHAIKTGDRTLLERALSTLNEDAGRAQQVMGQYQMVQQRQQASAAPGGGGGFAPGGLGQGGYVNFGSQSNPFGPGFGLNLGGGGGAAAAAAEPVEDFGPMPEDPKKFDAWMRKQIAAAGISNPYDEQRKRDRMKKWLREEGYEGLSDVDPENSGPQPPGFTAQQRYERSRTTLPLLSVLGGRKDPVSLVTNLLMGAASAESAALLSALEQASGPAKESLANVILRKLYGIEDPDEAIPGTNQGNR